jgi:hypothetical protein
MTTITMLARRMTAFANQGFMVGKPPMTRSSASTRPGRLTAKKIAMPGVRQAVVE